MRPAGSATAGDRPSNGSLDHPGALLGMSIVDAAKALLASKRTPLKNPDFAALFKAGGLHMNSKGPANTIGSVLSRRMLEVGDVVKVGRGTWGLKEWNPVVSKRKTPRRKMRPRPKPRQRPLQFAKAGFSLVSPACLPGSQRSWNERGSQLRRPAFETGPLPHARWTMDRPGWMAHCATDHTA